MLQITRWPFGLLLASLLGCGHAVPMAQGATIAATAPATAGWDPTSLAMGDCPNFAQASNGRLMTVVSRDHGRGAKAGALIELFYPNYAKEHLWDSYVGIAQSGGTRWAHQLKLERQALTPDAGVIESDFGGAGVGLVIQDAVDPANDVHLRRVTLTNRGAVPLTDTSLVAYAFFTLNELPGGDRLHYDPAAHALVQRDDGVAVAMAVDGKPSAWQCGFANLPFGHDRDARLAAEAGHLDGNSSAGPAVTGVNGAFQIPVAALAPGASTTMTLAFGAGADEAAALSAAKAGLADGWAVVAECDRTRWGGWLAASKMPTGVDASALTVYRRALITMGQMSASNGAIMAAPTNLSPLYRFVWPRDGSLVSLALAQAGHPESAKAFFAFCERLQRPDGGFAVNYFPDGSRPMWEFGKDKDEHDQVGLFAWGVMKTFDATHDPAWAAARWPAVRRACEFLMGEQQPNGLLTTCRDLWELDTDGSWTFSNAAAWAGLTAGARLAEAQGDTLSSARFRKAAVRLQAAVDAQLVVDGHFARGLRHGKPDPALEVANLALGSSWFGLVSDTDPRLLATGAAIATRLGTPEGGVRRHEGDHYYGGQPWPVTTGWLALHELSHGDVTSARARFNTLTRYAQSTEALMLGEQFDEHKSQWVSAFPLTWSEATYVRTALELSK
jgi:glucoamylase